MKNLFQPAMSSIHAAGPWSGETVFICDVSGSMAERAGTETRFGYLTKALRELVRTLIHYRIVAFNSTPHLVSEDADLPAPSGGTALHLALDAAAQFGPTRSCILSDGEPDSPDLARAAASRLSGRIDVVYCGDPSNHNAIAFLQSLARAGGGHFDCHDLVRAGDELALTVRKVMALPASKQITG